MQMQVTVSILYSVHYYTRNELCKLKYKKFNLSIILCNEYMISFVLYVGTKRFLCYVNVKKLYIYMEFIFMYLTVRFNMVCLLKYVETKSFQNDQSFLRNQVNLPYMEEHSEPLISLLNKLYNLGNVRIEASINNDQL